MEELKFLGRGGALAVEMGGNCAYLKDDKTLLQRDFYHFSHHKHYL